MRIFGSYYAAQGALHRAPIALKYALMVVVGVVPFVVGNPWVSVGAPLVAALILVGVGRMPWRSALRLPLPFVIVMAALFVYHCWATSSERGIVYICGVIAAMYMARVVTMTTREADILEAIAQAARPLRLLGIDPERIALAAALMWRSIPYLFDHVATARQAARAHGVTWAAPRLLIPVIVASIGYALTTQDALRARGLE